MTEYDDFSRHLDIFLEGPTGYFSLHVNVQSNFSPSGGFKEYQSLSTSSAMDLLGSFLRQYCS